MYQLFKNCNCDETPTNTAPICNHSGPNTSDYIYEGVATCAGIEPEDTITVVLQKIENFICSTDFTQYILDAIQENPEEYLEFITLINNTLECSTIFNCGPVPTTTTSTTAAPTTTTTSSSTSTTTTSTSTSTTSSTTSTTTSSTSSTTSTTTTAAPTTTTTSTSSSTTTTTTTTVADLGCTAILVTPEEAGVGCPTSVVLSYTDCNGFAQSSIVQVAGGPKSYCVLYSDATLPTIICGTGTIEVMGDCNANLTLINNSNSSLLGGPAGMLYLIAAPLPLDPLTTATGSHSNPGGGFGIYVTGNTPGCIRLIVNGIFHSQLAVTATGVETLYSFSSLGLTATDYISFELNDGACV